MARIYKIGSNANNKFQKLIDVTNEYYSKTYINKETLNYAIEYCFLEGFKTWENSIENLFVSYARYNDPVKGKRPYPYLAPKTEKHALEILLLEKQYIDWTSPDNIVSRAEVCFRKNAVLTSPIKASMQDLRDMKKIRNHIAHGSQETLRLFKDLSRLRIGSAEDSVGVYLNKISPDRVDQYIIFYLKILKGLVHELTNK